MDLGFKLRKGFLAPFRDTANALDSHNGFSRAMHNALRMKKLLNELHLPLIQDLVEVAPHQLLSIGEVFGLGHLGSSRAQPITRSVPGQGASPTMDKFPAYRDLCYYAPSKRVDLSNLRGR